MRSRPRCCHYISISASDSLSFLFYRVYKRQNRPEEALSQCDKSLQLLNDCNNPEKTCSVYKDMAAIEQNRGHLDRAVEHLSKARSAFPFVIYQT